MKFLIAISACLALATMSEAKGKGMGEFILEAGLAGGAMVMYPLLGHMVTYPHVYHRNMYRTFDTALSTLGHGHNQHVSGVVGGLTHAVDGVTHAVDGTLKSVGLG